MFGSTPIPDEPDAPQHSGRDAKAGPPVPGCGDGAGGVGADSHPGDDG
jgi:hypothetical protein